MTERVVIQRLPSGVPGLDEILGGGLPEFSFNVIAGGPGTGKTTLVQQIMFGLAGPDRRALFFTVLGEPPKINESVRFLSLADDLAGGTLDAILARIRARGRCRRSPARRRGFVHDRRPCGGQRPGR